MEEAKEGNNKLKGYSIASLVLGIVAIVLAWYFYISLPCSILAIVFGVKVRKKDKANKFAKAGFILGIISASLLAFLLICVIILVYILNISLGMLLLNNGTKPKNNDLELMDKAKKARIEAEEALQREESLLNELENKYGITIDEN